MRFPAQDTTRQTPAGQCRDVGIRPREAWRPHGSQQLSAAGPALPRPRTLPAGRTGCPPSHSTSAPRGPSSLAREQTSRGRVHPPAALASSPGGRLLVPNWDPGGGTLAIPAGLQGKCPRSPLSSTSSASSSAPLPTSAMFLLRLRLPKIQAVSFKPTSFLRSGLRPGPVWEGGGSPALPGGA